MGEYVETVFVSVTLAGSVQQTRSIAIIKPNKHKKLQTCILRSMDSRNENVKTAIVTVIVGRFNSTNKVQ